MSLILGIDCCSGWTNTGLAEDGLPLGEINIKSGRNQASLLPVLVSELLQNCGKGLKELELISVTSGPGYFTGIRVGMSYASALATGLNIRVVTLSSLETLIPQDLPEGIISISAIPSGKNKIFAAVYKNNSLIAGPGQYYPEELSFHITPFLDQPTISCYTTEPEKTGKILSNTGISTIKASFSRGIVVAVKGNSKAERSLLPDQIRPLYLADPQTS